MLELLRIQEFKWIIYKADTLSAPDTSDLEIQAVRARDRLTKEQWRFLRRTWSPLRIWYLLRLRGWGVGWVFLVKTGGEFAHWTFVTPARRYRKELPVMTESKALLLGPSFTEEAFRGRSIYPRMLRHVVNDLAGQGYGPFYINVRPDNAPSMRGIEKAGFARCGVWAGHKRGLNLSVTSRRVGD